MVCLCLAAKDGWWLSAGKTATVVPWPLGTQGAEGGHCCIQQLAPGGKEGSSGVEGKGPSLLPSMKAPDSGKPVTTITALHWIPSACTLPPGHLTPPAVSHAGCTFPQPYPCPPHSALSCATQGHVIKCTFLESKIAVPVILKMFVCTAFKTFWQENYSLKVLRKWTH